MKATKRVMALLLAGILLCAAVPAVLADDEESAPLTDSTNEFMPENNEVLIQGVHPLMMAGAPTYASGSFTGTSEFIDDTAKSTYMDRMIAYYIETSADLQATLTGGKAAIFLFEGGNDDGIIEADGTRTGAVCIVVKQIAGVNTIVYYSKDCSTLPDYPFAYEYENGHDGYGAATLLDGIYPLVTVQHRDIYAGFQIRCDGVNCAPCLYMNEDGDFSVLNGTGIHIHTRIGKTVSGDESTPYTAGCLTVNGGHPFDGYMEFLANALPDPSVLVDAVFDGGAIQALGSSADEYKAAGTLVMDRALAREDMLSVYGGNEDAVARITYNSAAAAEDAVLAADVLSGCTVYPSNLTAQPEAGVVLSAVPGTVGNTAETTDGSAMTVVGLYENEAGELWYRVLAGTDARYIPAEDAGTVTPNYDDMTIHSYNYPQRKLYGKSFGVYGIVSGAWNALDSVTASVSMGTTLNCASSSDDILASLSLDNSDGWDSYADSIDYGLAFSGLAVGTHTYRVIAGVKNYFADGGEVTYAEEGIQLVEEDFVVYAKVTFDPDVTGVEPIVLETNENGCITNFPAPTRDGYDLVGWMNGDTAVAADTVFTGPVTLKAKWQKQTSPSPSPSPSASPDPSASPASSPDPNEAPRTGDCAALALWMYLTVASAGAVAVLLMRKKHP